MTAAAWQPWRPEGPMDSAQGKATGDRIKNARHAMRRSERAHERGGGSSALFQSANSAGGALERSWSQGGARLGSLALGWTSSAPLARALLLTGAGHSACFSWMGGLFARAGKTLRKHVQKEGSPAGTFGNDVRESGVTGKAFRHDLRERGGAGKAFGTDLRKSGATEKTFGSSSEFSEATKKRFDEASKNAEALGKRLGKPSEFWEAMKKRR